MNDQPDDPSIVPLPFGRMWSLEGCWAAAYTNDIRRAAAIAGVAPREISRRAMAVYYAANGRPIAWQVRFDVRRAKEVRDILTRADTSPENG